MLPASVKGPGMNMGFPDVCLTPAFPSPIPIPYPNMGMHAMAAPFCPTILNMMMPALNMGSIIPMTLGDQPGVANPMFMQMGMFTMGSPKVLLQCMPAITLTCPTSGNNMNNPVGAVLVPGAPTILYGFDASPEVLEIEEPLGALRFDDQGVHHLAIHCFTPDLPARFHAVASAHLGEIEALEIDLRQNPGGDVVAAIELARDLLDEGALVCTLEDTDGDRVRYEARGDAYGFRITLRVDGKTASAAELFAGALKAHGRARVVGEKTYGKASSTAKVANRMLDVARMILPNGREITGGIEPDV